MTLYDVSMCSSDRPFACDKCPKTYKYASNLAQHKRMHSGVRPFECETCGKAFYRSDVLKVHKYIHTGERPYRCRVCDKTFKHSGTLYHHKRAHQRDLDSSKSHRVLADLTNNTSTNASLHNDVNQSSTL